MDYIIVNELYFYHMG